MKTFNRTIAAGTALVASSFSALAEEPVVETTYSLPKMMASGFASTPTGFNVLTFPGQNTNGEDLKCLVYKDKSTAGGQGGLDCNWTQPTPKAPTQ